MSDYHYLNDVLAMKDLSLQIEKLDMKIDECTEDVDENKIYNYNMRK